MKQTFIELSLINIWSWLLIKNTDQLSRNVQLAFFCHFPARIYAKLDSRNNVNDSFKVPPHSYLRSNSSYPSDIIFKLFDLIHSFIHSFIHSGHFYSAPSSPLPLRGAPDYSTDTVSVFHAEAHRQLQVKDLPKVPT